MKKVFHFDSQTDMYRADACVVSCFDARFELVTRKFLKKRGIWWADPLKIAGGAKAFARIRAHLRARAGANLDAAAQDNPGDADGPQRLWSIRWVASVRGQRGARGGKSRVGITAPQSF
ncbi:MAG: hypothetical protein E6J74_39950 [Deltaproteobacteria bacterium]|nr:MAG: hypothetical protein E6J74_39950 [Deltaproteobacteria bacterium]